MSPEQIKILIISLSVLGALIIFSALVVLISYLTYRMVFMRRRREYDPYYGLDAPSFARNHLEAISKMIDRLSEEECEEVYITSHDGLRLAAKYYHRKDGAPIHVICHGYKSSPLRDGSGGGCDSREMGHNLLLIYERSHGKSEGETITFGIRERYDIIAWTKYLTERFGEDTEIILIGTSMGAASVILAAGLGMPDTVRCVIADCPYSSAGEAIRISAKRMGYPAKLAYPFIKLGARIFGHFSPEAASPIEAIKDSKLPILIAHGEEDGTVPVEMSRRMAKAAQEAGVDCTLATFPNADHCMSFIVDYERYARIRNEFLKKHVRAMSDERN